MKVLDREEALEEMLDLFVAKKLLNITASKATDPSPSDDNTDHIMLE